MNSKIGDLSEKLPDALRPVVFLILTLTVVIAAYVAVGIQTVDAKGECYTKTVMCHGFRTGSNGNECLGWEVKNVDYVEKNSCDIGQIKRQCGRVKTALCQGSSGSEWKDEGIVMGRTCAKWNQVYDLGMTSCQQ